MTKYIAIEYNYEDNILYTISNEFNDLYGIIKMISEKYPNKKHYMTFSEGDDKYIIKFNEDDNNFFIVQEVYKIFIYLPLLDYILVSFLVLPVFFQRKLLLNLLHR